VNLYHLHSDCIDDVSHAVECAIPIVLFIDLNNNPFVVGHFLPLFPPSDPLLQRGSMNREKRLLAHGLIRLILERYYSCSMKNVVSTRNDYGKLMLIPPFYTKALIHFNISYTEGAIALILSSRSVVGVDIEKILFFEDMGVSAQSVFCHQEFKIFQGLSRKEQTVYFYKVWCAKEAALKALSMGLSVDPREVCINVSDSSYSYKQGNILLADLRFFDIANLYTIAACESR
jgi:phosphopantetheinyl transferase